jgi:YjbE family integral membrane protein
LQLLELHAMDWLSADFFGRLLVIIVINLMLSGDNAIVIALAARKLPKPLRSKAVFGGTLAAIVLRVVATLAIVWLLKLPGLQLVGGIMLLWIAYQLIAPDSGEGAALSKGAATAGIWSAIRTIVIADAVMSLDNMLGVAAAAQGSLVLVVLGLISSIPVMIVGSTLILKLVDRYSWIMYLGAAVLAWTAAKLLLDEPWLEHMVKLEGWVPWALQATLIGGVLMAGFLQRRTQAVRSGDL